MTSAIISDTTGKTIKADTSYTLDVYSRGNKTHIKFDTEMNEELMGLIKLAIQNHVEWFKLKKNDEGQWERLKVPDPIQERL